MKLSIIGGTGPQGKGLPLDLLRQVLKLLWDHVMSPELSKLQIV